jgi:hypothetical protein
VQLLMRSVQGSFFHVLPKRSLEQQRQEAKIREQRNVTHAFGYYEGGERPGQECARLHEQDSSLNILELMGAIPDASDKSDSDAALVSRMHAYIGPVSREDGDNTAQAK